MPRATRALVLALSILGPGILSPAGAAPEEEPRSIDRIVFEETDSAEERGFFSDYVGDQKDALFAWLSRRFPGTRIWVQRAGQFIVPAAQFLAIAAAVLILALVIRWLVRRARSDTEQELLAKPLTTVDPPDEEPDLRAEVAACLARGDRRAAVAAVWRHLVRRLAGRGIGDANERLTNREYVRRVRRGVPEWPGQERLVGFARRVEFALYGPDTVNREQIVRLVEMAEDLVRA